MTIEHAELEEKLQESEKNAEKQKNDFSNTLKQ